MMTPQKVTAEPGHAGKRRIAVLLTNNDESEFSNQFPNDGEKVCALLKGQRPDWEYKIYAVKDDVFPRMGSADGYIITGSPASVHDSLPWIAKLESLIQDLDRQHVPLIGLCFGHQVIATALGGRVSRNPGGWRFGLANTHFEVLEPWMQPVARDLRLHACHSEQVTELPPTARRLGGDPFCPIGSFACGEHIFTTEYHPEFSHDFMMSLANAYQGEVPDEVLEAGRQELRGTPHSELFSQWAVLFFDGSRTVGSAGIA